VVRVFASVGDVAASVGETIGPGPWRVVDQARVDAFAAATDDRQWIHVDPVRAAAGPFGATVAHGYLTLSLLPSLMKELYVVEGARMAVNYGLNRVRFPSPLRVGAAIRARVEIASVDPVEGGVQLVMKATVDADTGPKPVCVAESVSRLYAQRGKP